MTTEDDEGERILLLLFGLGGAFALGLLAAKMICPCAGGPTGNGGGGGGGGNGGGGGDGDGGQLYCDGLSGGCGSSN